MDLTLLNLLLIALNMALITILVIAFWFASPLPLPGAFLYPWRRLLISWVVATVVVLDLLTLTLHVIDVKPMASKASPSLGLMEISQRLSALDQALEDIGRKLPKISAPLLVESDVVDLSKFDFVRDLGLVGQLDLNYLQSDIKAIIAGTQCKREKDASGERFVCTGTFPACTFTWALDPIPGLGAKGIAIVAGRSDVVSPNFSNGGYAWYGPPKTGDDSDPKIGVAIVTCDQNRVFRSAFVFSHGADIKTYGSLFRTRGYDWISRAHLAPPYLPEIFSIAALRSISQWIWSDRSSEELQANDRAILLDKADIATLRTLNQDALTVGNNSDYGLGMSRGACALTMLAAGVNLPDVHIAPSEVIEDYHSLTPSAVTIASGSTPKSVPCPLITTWLSQFATPANALPSAYTSSQMKYPARDGFNGKEGVWQAYAVRTGGVMLHMFGYQVDKPGNDVLTGPKGQWPRPELLK